VRGRKKKKGQPGSRPTDDGPRADGRQTKAGPAFSISVLLLLLLLLLLLRMMMMMMQEGGG
jgi:hypothetical protein